MPLIVTCLRHAASLRLLRLISLIIFRRFRRHFFDAFAAAFSPAISDLFISSYFELRFPHFCCHYVFDYYLLIFFADTP